MSTPVNTDSGLLTAAVGAAGCAGCVGLPTPPQDPYRFYQCRFESPLHIVCRPIPNDAMHERIPGVITMLMPIENWIPQSLDKAVIRKRLFDMRTLQFEDANK